MGTDFFDGKSDSDEQVYALAGRKQMRLQDLNPLMSIMERNSARCPLVAKVMTFATSGSHMATGEWSLFSLSFNPLLNHRGDFSNFTLEAMVVFEKSEADGYSAM